MSVLFTFPPIAWQFCDSPPKRFVLRVLTSIRFSRLTWRARTGSPVPSASPSSNSLFRTWSLCLCVTSAPANSSLCLRYLLPFLKRYYLSVSTVIIIYTSNCIKNFIAYVGYDFLSVILKLFDELFCFKLSAKIFSKPKNCF